MQKRSPKIVVPRKRNIFLGKHQIKPWIEKHIFKNHSSNKKDPIFSGRLRNLQKHSVKNYSSPQKRNCISRKARKPGKVERHIAQKNQERKKQYFLEGFQTGKRTTQRYFLKVSQTRKRGVSTIIDKRKESIFVQRLRNLQKRSFKNHSSKKQSIFLERKHRPKKLKGTIFPHKGRALKQEQHITQSYSCKKKKQFLDGSKNKTNRAQIILFKHPGEKKWKGSKHRSQI